MHSLPSELRLYDADVADKGFEVFDQLTNFLGIAFSGGLLERCAQLAYPVESISAARSEEIMSFVTDVIEVIAGERSPQSIDVIFALLEITDHEPPGERVVHDDRAVFRFRH